MEELHKLLEEIRECFDAEGWYCVLSDKSSFNQNPDLSTDFDVDFEYKDLRVLSIIDIENRLVMNCYFYIIDDNNFCLIGDPVNNEKPINYNINNMDKEKLVQDIKKVLNYY